MDDQPEPLWGVPEVAAYLYQWRHNGYGPRGRRVGRYVRYDPDDVRRWFAAQDDGVA
ncbi:excisionase [Pseudonocardia nigra]|uniref:excisionase n=1 Tax=Pseudonocardia nigra TaxID=1921578 RepID=UPI001C5FBC62|nr:excisionase [Pseudonocardia nigra]